ncbi:BrnT family toxin [Bdellovibrio sp. GT3]|uniref:BrnT family toxin n=1 Tax=Bdellovibrio sp. GT3 TaxID=3136282 RepID=UPI0030F158D8
MDYVEFEWDDAKAASNYRKHGVRFSEAVTIWKDESAIEVADLDHSTHEERWVRIGLSVDIRVIVVVYTERFLGFKVRVISARKATAVEVEQYMVRKI